MGPSPRLIRRVVSACALVCFVVAAEGVAFADCPFAVRAATAEEQKFYADSFAQFQKAAPPAPAGWTMRDSVANGVLKEVCAKPGERVLSAAFGRSYNRAEAEVQARQAEALTKVTALMQANMAAMKAGKPVDYEAFDAATKRIDAEALRDTGAQFQFRTGVAAVSHEGFSPFAAPVGRGYRRALTEHGVTRHTVNIVLNPTAPAGSLKVVHIEGDPARVEALIKAASWQ